MGCGGSISRGRPTRRRWPRQCASRPGRSSTLPGGSLRSLATQLRLHRALICLDNCEHLLEAVAELAETVIRSCPEVSILATSREPLGVPGERVWRLPTLAPVEAVELFAERAGQACPGFTVDATNIETVERLCLGLDCIPLGVELAPRGYGR